ncbi:MAG: hypothetical protein U9P72_06490 [Campylobacterota bacterium]|nr:hypothetical protein [Campylobacterota bacterium]
MFYDIKKAILLASLVLLFSACSDSVTDAQNYCIEQNGIVHDDMCEYQEEVQFDDGVSTFTHQCELTAFYEDRCHEIEDGDTIEFLSPSRIVQTRDYEQTRFLSPSNSITVSSIIDNRVKDILRNLENTGYSHNRDDNFSLFPKPLDLKEIDASSSLYNLFLDC